MMINLESLKEHRFFSDLTDEELSIIAKIITPEDFKNGETVFKTSDAGHCLYLIRSGEVKVCLAAPDGDLFTLTILKNGDVFGEMGFIDATPRSATIIAISDVDAFVIEKEAFETLIDDHPRMVHKVLKNIVHTVHSIVRGMNSRYIEMINYMWGRKRFC
ncbi:MAG: cyclic nucleotide-binding domain-containing protein [Desulfobacterales bacterium]